MASHCSTVHPPAVTSPQAPGNLPALFGLHLPFTHAVPAIPASSVPGTCPAHSHLGAFASSIPSTVSLRGWCPLILKDPLFRKTLLASMSQADPSPTTLHCLLVCSLMPIGWFRITVAYSHPDWLTSLSVPILALPFVKFTLLLPRNSSDCGSSTCLP